jgi:hypothetical protein
MDAETDGDQLDAMRRLCAALGDLLPDEQIDAQTRIDQTAELLARALATETADDIDTVVADVYRHAG